MHEISIELIEYLEIYVDMVNDYSSDVQDGFDEHTLYLDFARTDSTELLTGENNTATQENSPLYIFKLLDANPSRTLKELKSKYSFYTDSGPLEITKAAQRKNTFLIMMQFLNISAYLYKYIERSGLDQSEQDSLVQKLVIAASAEYDSLYSSRSKNEFAYYFEKLLTSKCNETIGTYNSDKHRWKYNESTRKLKEEIDQMTTTPYGDKMKTEYYSNIAITYGMYKDINFPEMGFKYFINIGIVSGPDDYNSIFNTNFE